MIYMTISQMECICSDDIFMTLYPTIYTTMDLEVLLSIRQWATHLQDKMCMAIQQHD